MGRSYIRLHGFPWLLTGRSGDSIMSDIPKLWLDGSFNHADPWFNIPFYIWGLVLWWIIVIPVAWFILKGIKWDKFNKFHGLHYAKKNDSAAVIIVDFMGEADMIAENKAKCIFDYSADDYEVTIPDVPLNIIKIAGVIIALLGIAIILQVNAILGIVLVIAGIVAYFINRILPWLVSTLFFYPTHYLKDISWQDAIKYKIGGINYDCKIAQILQGDEWDRYPVVICGGISVEIIASPAGIGWPQLTPRKWSIRVSIATIVSSLRGGIASGLALLYGPPGMFFAACSTIRRLCLISSIRTIARA